MQYKKDHQLFFLNRRYPGCLGHNWLQDTPAISVEGCFPPSIIRFESCRHQFHSLLYFHRIICTRCWGICGNLQQRSLQAKQRISFLTVWWVLLGFYDSGANCPCRNDQQGKSTCESLRNFNVVWLLQLWSRKKWFCKISISGIEDVRKKRLLSATTTLSSGSPLFCSVSFVII